jgi:hypothetical protein
MRVVLLSNEKDPLQKKGQMAFDFGESGFKGQKMATGQANVKAYNRYLRQLIHALLAVPNFGNAATAQKNRPRMMSCRAGCTSVHNNRLRLLPGILADEHMRNPLRKMHCPQPAIQLR